MCARFTLAVPDFAWLARALELVVDPEIARLYRPRYNIAPSTAHLVLRARSGQRELFPARWGLVPRWADASAKARGAKGSSRAAAAPLINARSETARTKPAFRGAFAERRCVVPADGFYEWSGPKAARRPTWFHPASGGLLRFAGLYEASVDPATGRTDVTFTVLTTGANAVVAPFHDRMPALLAPEDVDAWLGGAAERAEALLRPAPPEALAARPVSSRANSVAHDDPSLLREAREEHVEAQGTLPLFGPRG